MDIAVARTFLEVVKTGSFVRAAGTLNLTQTAISARIRVLEDQLGRPVFIRNKSGATLTPAGQQFFRFAATLVQVWDRALRSVALPEGRETVVAIGAELSLWSPLLRHWLLWMRRERPDVAVATTIGNAEALIDQIQNGTLDAAVVYAAPHKPGLIVELLFEEKLVLARTTPTATPLRPEDHVSIDWGEGFATDYHTAFPLRPSSVVSVDYGPLALDYILAVGGSGYFRHSFIQPYLNEGRLALVPGNPEFAYSAYVVHSVKADPEQSVLIRTALRAAADNVGTKP